MRKSLFGTTTLLTLFGVATAMAQSNPSAQQIINQLKPSGSVSDTTRGIKALSPSGNEATGGGVSSPGINEASSGNMSPHASKSVTSPGSAPSANLDIDFMSGSATLTPKAEAALDQLGKALTSSQLASYNFKIVGHTDTVGDATTNQTLSEQRATAVKSYLESKYGVAESRLQTQGVGEADLMVQTPPNTSNARNRRVEVINLGQ